MKRFIQEVATLIGLIYDEVVDTRNDKSNNFLHIFYVFVHAFYFTTDIFVF